MIFQWCVIVSESGKGYSDYAQNLSNVMNGMLFFAGFVLAVVAILLTSLPNPKNIQSQFTLFLLTIIFYLTVFLAFFFLLEVPYHVENMPPSTRRKMTVNVLIFLTFLLIGLTFPLLFLLWDLTLLATISSLIWLLYAVSSYLFVYSPFHKWRSDKGNSG